MLHRLSAGQFEAQTPLDFWILPALVVRGLSGLMFLLVVVKEIWNMQRPSFGDKWFHWFGGLKQICTSYPGRQFAKRWCTIQSFLQNLFLVRLYYIHQQVVCFSFRDCISVLFVGWGQWRIFQCSDSVLGFSDFVWLRWYVVQLNRQLG